MPQLNPRYEAIFKMNHIIHPTSDIRHRSEHFCYFDDMYSPEYSLQWIYEDIMKYDIDEESRKLLEEGHEEIKQSECYQEYGLPMYIYRINK